MRPARLLAAVAVLGAAAAPACANSLVAARAIPARTIVDAADVRLAARAIPGALNDAGQARGLETRVTIYAGRPIRAGDLAPPALVERNALVRLRYESGALAIVTEGRSLDRGALGERVRVMNLASRTVITGRVAGAAEILVSERR